jgi:uncharacterized membrane protein
MLNLLLHLVAPGYKLPPGTTQFSISPEGLSWGWAFFALVTFVVAVTWSYRIYAPGISRSSRIGLIILRSVLLALLLLLLVRPVLLITIVDSVRRPLLVLLDLTQSMGLADQRTNPDDLTRAGIAKGLLDPAGGLKQSLDAANADSLKQLSRQQLLEALAANPRMNLWPRLYANADATFFGFSRKLIAMGQLAPRDGGKLATDDSAVFFHGVHYNGNLTALGDGLRSLLDQERGQSVSGVFVITDGANNTGSSPIEAAAMAKQDGVPLFIYGVGVTTPQDIIVTELDAPQVSNVKERLEVTVHIRAQSMLGKRATVQLKANGKVVDEQPVEFRADGDQELTLGYTPDAVGEADLEATIPPLPEEAVKDNNTATTKVRIVDAKLKVLLVEEEPRWDYQYLLTMLQRDRRITLKVVLIKGDADLTEDKDSPFLDKLPEDKDTLYANDVIIIGDVDPNDLGDTRMKLLNDWVNKMGGGMVFLAGPMFDPNAFQRTPLEALLPVETLTKTSERYETPVQLKLTPAGETSPMLTLSENPQENAAIWEAFPGVRWTAWVGKARPGAQVLLTDPTPDRATASGPMPVMAMQSYGLGQSLYIGFDETYRWRSGKGEKYYTHIWGQMLQTLSAQRGVGTSALTQLKTDRPSYLTGDKVRISGRIFKAGFEPLTDPEVPGTITWKAKTAPGKTAPGQQTTDLSLEAVPDRPGEYQGEMTAATAGSYSFSVVRDPSVILKFEVADSKVELSDVAMNEKLLREMATASGGQFLREEDLNGLPELIASKSTGSVTFKKIPLVYTPYLLGLIILIACAEWLWRRKLELK